MNHELPTSTIARSTYLTLEGKPMHRTYAALGAPNCPRCYQAMLACGFGIWGDEIRNQWRCTNVLCREFDHVFTRSTLIVDETPAGPARGCAMPVRAGLSFASSWDEINYGFCPAPALPGDDYCAKHAQPEETE